MVVFYEIATLVSLVRNDRTQYCALLTFFVCKTAEIQAFQGRAMERTDSTQLKGDEVLRRIYAVFSF